MWQDFTCNVGIEFTRFMLILLNFWLRVYINVLVQKSYKVNLKLQGKNKRQK